MSAKIRVVVVDDNYDANVAISRLLERLGFDVVGRAYDGLSGLNVIKEEKPDVAILDLAMPALDGFGVAQRVHSEMQAPPRLVALTAFGRELEEDAERVGFDSFFCKPADTQALKRVLESYQPS
jgi:two-component system CheB/CheR fusion protein